MAQDSKEKSKTVPLPDKVYCEVCQREIPRADAIKDEGDDYVLWFCGFDCYQKRRDAGQDKTK